MRVRTLVLAAVIGLSASPVAAQVDQDDISEGAYDDAPDEAGEGEEASAPAKEEPGDPNVGEESEPASDDGRPADDEGRDEPGPPPPAPEPPARTPPAPSPDPAPARSPIKRLQGALVLARDPASRGPARALARAVYGDERLRPRIAEKTAQVLVGGAPAPGNAEQAQIAAVMKALDTVEDDEVRRRLLVSLADDLSAQLVVEVTMDADGAPRARVLRLPDETFVGVTLTSQRTGDPPAWAWDDAVGILRGLIVGPPPGPRTAPAPAPPPKPTDTAADDESDWDLLKSPWFWGGLGVVVTVGVTVLILSQTALNEPDVVMLEGRVAP